MIDSELEANEQGKLGRRQARALYRYVYLQFSLLTLIIGFVVIFFVLATRSISILCIVSLIPLTLFVCFLFVPTFRQLPNLMRDARDGKVIQDCGLITYYYAQSIYVSPYGRPSEGYGKAFVLVDNERTYWWHRDISDGFESGEPGCVYFMPRTRLAIGVEILPEG